MSAITVAQSSTNDDTAQVLEASEISAVLYETPTTASNADDEAVKPTDGTQLFQFTQQQSLTTKTKGRVSAKCQRHRSVGVVVCAMLSSSGRSN